jgi:hypothetical protein
MPELIKLPVCPFFSHASGRIELRQLWVLAVVCQVKLAMLLIKSREPAARAKQAHTSAAETQLLGTILKCLLIGTAPLRHSSRPIRMPLGLSLLLLLPRSALPPCFQWWLRISSRGPRDCIELGTLVCTSIHTSCKHSTGMSYQSLRWPSLVEFLHQPWQAA